MILHCDKWLLKTASLLVNQIQENFFHVCYFKIIEPIGPVVHLNPIATAYATSVVKDRSMSLLCTTQRYEQPSKFLPKNLTINDLFRWSQLKKIRFQQ